MAQLADKQALTRRRSKQLVGQQPAGMPSRLEWIPTAEFKLANRGLRKHTPQQESMLMSSISTFGFLTPLVVTDDMTVIVGELRLQAARKMGLESLPVLRASHLSPAQVEAFRIADNKIQEHGAWDEQALRDALASALANDFDLQALGFTVAGADIVLAEPLSLTVGETVTPPSTSLLRIGDSFAIGAHRVLCGDAFNPDHYVAVMGEDKAAMVFTDPPFNLSARSIGGKGRIKHREFVAANGEMSGAEFEDYLRSSTALLSAQLHPGALAYVCMDWRNIRLLLNAADSIGLELIDIVIWAKTGAGMGSFYRSQHEMIAVLRVPGALHRNNVELGRHGRNRTNVWSYAGANVFGPMRNEALAMHPTVKPVDLILDAIKDCTQRGDIILDPFGGSGSTLIAAQKAGRTGRIIEIDSVYVETILVRYQRIFGVAAIHEESGLPFSELISMRSQDTAVEAPPRARPPRVRPAR